MADEIWIDRQGSLLRAVRVAGRPPRLRSLALDRLDWPWRSGDLVIGRVIGAAPMPDALLVDVGPSVPGLLPTARRSMSGAREDGAVPRSGARLLLQVSSEPVRANRPDPNRPFDKGPDLTADIALPGRFLVFHPHGHGVQVSRRASGGAGRAKRTELSSLAASALGPWSAQGGWTIRGAGAAALMEGAAARAPMLAAEAEALAGLWRRIQDLAEQGTAQQGPGPGRLWHGPSAPLRLMLDEGPPERVRGAEPMVLRDLSQDCLARAPSLTPLAQGEAGPADLFDIGDVAGSILALSEPMVALSGGARLWIERTRALWAADVDAGSRRDHLAVNLDAVVELSRQMRLRNLSGTIVLDAIGLGAEADRNRVRDALVRAVADDPIPTQVHGMSRLGLIEITRSRRGASVDELLQGLDP